MGVVVLDGPEKAGKTSMAHALRRVDPRVTYRHWGPVSTHEEYYPAMMEDVLKPWPVVWDRSWASESVYSCLLGRDRPLGNDPFLGEWLYGRSVLSCGVRIILAPMPPTLAARRAAFPDPADLPITPEKERAAFVAYGDRWGWSVFYDWDETTVRVVLERAWAKVRAADGRVPPKWAGPQNSRVIFLGEARNEAAPFQVPFSTENPTKYGRALGPLAMKCGWTNVPDANPDDLRGRLVIACGVDAQAWCAKHDLKWTPVPHPSWLYRWRAGLAKSKDVEADLVRVVTQAMTAKGVPSG